MESETITAETQPVYSPEELTEASIQLLTAVEASAALQDQLTDRVLHIERYLAEGVTATNRVEAIETPPQIHVRIAHVHTIKDGWRLAETTVSYDGPLPTSPADKSNMWGQIERAMKQAHESGTVEAGARNETPS